MRKVLIAAIVTALLLVLPAGATGSSRAARAAKRDAVRRLHTAPVPPHSQIVPHLHKPFQLSGPPFESVTPNIVNVHSFFVTTLGRDKAYAWFKAHPPPKAGASRLISTGPGSSLILGFQWGDSRLVEERVLYVSVIARPSGGAAIRIDSQATWGDKSETA